MNLVAQAQHPTQIDSWEVVLMNIVQKISLTPAQYDLITDRYSNLQAILNVAEDAILKDAHIFVQGSIGLKTTIKPAPEAEGDMANVDADAIVLLPNAQNVDSKEVLDALTRRFEEGTRTSTPIKPLRRGIRIVYADENPGFHIDVTPARNARGNGQSAGYGNLEVPDRETGWKCSTPRDYSLWLENLAKLEIQIIRKMAGDKVLTESATQDPLPLYEDYAENNPLRATIKLLKRHRDQWALNSESPEYRPISAVITTLAAKAYEKVYKESQAQALRPIEAIIKIIAYMPQFITQVDEGFAVLNPKDSGENFAEKWNRPNGEGESYREAFFVWHSQALESVLIGLNDLGNSASFENKLMESFGVPRAFIKEQIINVPDKSWTLPGRSSQITLNALALNALTGSSSSTASIHTSNEPVGRLG
ncbi:nucleotidyltransferase [Acinetobacter ursingii]|uniref:nucleotidyltransferase domain-containing protein n=1 Tax=Acinetobacter ursingii TaxID=108980 RepID=UPI0022EA7CDB|nr:nucleotidyltransferase [Acinetobacter ursingii]MDA3579277.1 nucleotidyltransferase [Acinetobacter ursingii]MDH0807419.1 nucleotidyltransferase [Acinetobacter ursingii]MDH2074477.1 nucleotidyltransferase [Acinetobacter ursingii]